MKVCRIITRLNVGGPAKQVEVLNELDIETTVMSGKVEEGEYEYGSPDILIGSLQRGVNLVNDWRAYREIKHHLRVLRPDLVHTHTSKAGCLGRLAAWRLGIPSVHTYHGHVFHSYFGRCKTAIIKLVEKVLARISTRIIAISPSQRDELVGVIGNGDRVRVIWNGFDLSPFCSKLDKKGARNTLCWRRDIPIALFVGRDTLVKRRDRFWKYCIEKGYYGLPVSGFIPPHMMPLVYKACDELIICSDNEGTPTAYIEAIVSGLPVTLLTRPGGVKDLVKMTRDEILETFDKERLKKDIINLYEEIV